MGLAGVGSSCLVLGKSSGCQDRFKSAKLSSDTDTDTGRGSLLGSRPRPKAKRRPSVRPLAKRSCSVGGDDQPLALGLSGYEVWRGAALMFLTNPQGVWDVEGGAVPVENVPRCMNKRRHRCSWDRSCSRQRRRLPKSWTKPSPRTSRPEAGTRERAERDYGLSFFKATLRDFLAPPTPQASDAERQTDPMTARVTHSRSSR